MKKWFKYIKPYLAYFILGPLCMIIEVIGEILMPKMLGYIIDYCNASLGNNESEISSFVQYLLDRIGGSNAPLVLAIMAGMILTAILMMIGGVGGAYFGAKAAVNFASDLREDIYRKIQKFSFANIDRFQTGSLVTRITNDVTQMQNFVNMMLRMALRSPGMLIGAVIAALGIDASLTSIIAITVPALLVVIVLFVTKGFPRFSRVQEKIDGLNSTVRENITNVRVVKSFVREDFETEKFNKANSELKQTGMSAMKMMILLGPAMSLFMNVTILLVLWFGGNRLVGGTLSVGELSTFVTYISQILFSLMMVTFLFVQFSRAMASAKRIREVLDEEIHIDDINAKYPDRQVTKGDIEFRNVNFRYYKHSEDKVLSDINVKIPAGTTVGVIGSTGCGKTTLVSMIPRLYDTDEGEVLIDGVNVRDYSLYNLREGVGMVLQKNVLFSGTIEENLRWGNQEATEEEIRAAAESAQAHKFVSSFTDGYQTDLDQGGTNVSGGQKQRLCIARALLKKPKILILDDSTSAVDTATEAQIREAFRTTLSGSTKIIIAQRISSVKDADMIIVMNDGVITGIGTHDELIHSNTEYQEIYNSQTGKEAK